MKKLPVFLIFCLFFLLFGAGVYAEMADDETVAEIRKVQDRQKWLLKNYNEQVKDLHESFKDQIAELGKEETTDKRRNQIIEDLNTAEFKLKSSFQTKMNELQQQEKALRSGTKEEPAEVILSPEEDRPLTPEEILQEAEKERLEIQERVKKAQEEHEAAQAKAAREKKEVKDSIGKRLRDSDEEKSKHKQRKAKKKPDVLKLLSDGRSRERTNR